MNQRGMLLVGQFDSPFVRRVAIALGWYGVPFEHRPWSVWADAEELARLNPLRRVPVLQLVDGESLVESGAILDYLDEQADPARLLLPRGGPERRRGLRVMSLATGLADKAVSLLYEHVLRGDKKNPVWVDRCERQIRDVFAVLDADRGRGQSEWWLGPRLSHADIGVACALRFTREAHPGLFEPTRYSALAGHAARCEALPEFQAYQQALTVTMKK